jgi:hypothetical protein
LSQPPVTIPGEESGLARADAPPITREVFDHTEQKAAYGFDNVDAMPRPVSETTSDDTTVLPLHPDTFVCMADYRKFSLRDDAAKLLVEFAPTEVKRTGGQFGVPYGVAIAKAGAESAHLIALDVRTGLVLVEPARRQCKHYVRQLVDFSGRRRSFVARMCTALRDESGEYQSLRDTGVYACELRDPPEDAGTRELDDFDSKKIAEGALRDEVATIFDVDAALVKQPLEKQLIGSWLPRDAIAEHDPKMRTDSGLLIRGETAPRLLALNMLRTNKGAWMVMGSNEVRTCAHSRHWPAIVRSDEYLFVMYDEAGRHLYRVIKADANYPREQAIEAFGPDVAARIQHEHVVLLTIERQEQ